MSIIIYAYIIIYNMIVNDEWDTHDVNFDYSYVNQNNIIIFYVSHGFLPDFASYL